MRAERERPKVPEKPCLMCMHDYCQCRVDQAAWDAAHDPTAPQPPLARDPEWPDLPQEC